LQEHGKRMPVISRIVKKGRRVMKKLVRSVIIVVAVAAVAVFGYLRFRTTQASASAPPMTATVQRGSMSATVAAAGNIEARQTADLSFGQSGTVEAINAAVGDSVRAGDLLAELDTADLELQLRSAEVSLKNAQDTLAQTENPNTEQEISNARATLASAQAAYDKVAAGATQSELEAAKAALASAQAAYIAAVESANAADSSLVSSAATFEKARIALQSAQADYDKVAWRGDAAATGQAQTLQSATLDYDASKAAYEALVATSKSDASSKIASAASALQSAKTSLAKLQDQVTEADLAAAQATLTQAQNNLDELLAGPDAVSLDIARNGVETAQIALEQVKLKLQQARIVAPFDGVITAVDAVVGQTASGTAVTIADLDHLEIVVNMSEVDVNRLQTGQQVEITLDAVTDITLEGSVTQIAPAGVQSSGVVNYPVTVALTNTAGGVKTGMTANLSIIVDQRENVLTVPNRAVRTIPLGKQKVVALLSNGQQVQTPVEAGLSNDTVTEIISGLKEGDVVVLNTTTAASTSGGGMGGIPGAGGPPPGM
jgi:HlyD family secretion protein